MTRRTTNPPAFDGTRDNHDYSQDAKVPAPYQVVRRLHRYVLMYPSGPKKTLKAIYTCKAASEMGCHRESIVYLKDKKKIPYSYGRQEMDS